MNFFVRGVFFCCCGEGELSVVLSWGWSFKDFVVGVCFGVVCLVFVSLFFFVGVVMFNDFICWLLVMKFIEN